MEKIQIKAEAREMGKKGVTGRLRKSGFIPAILYGRGDKPVGVSVNAKEMTRLLKTQGGTNVLIDLEIDGKPVVVMVKDYQIDVLSRHMTHIDFLKIDLTARLTVKIPVKVVGKAAGLQQGGLLEIHRRELEVKCLPGKIPSEIEVDVTPLEVGNTLHVNQVKLPEGVEMEPGADFAIVSIVAPRAEEAAPAVAAAPAEGAEGAAAAPAAAEGEKKETKEAKAPAAKGEKK